MAQVKENDTIKVHYTGSLDEGEVFDSSKESDPLQFKVGEGKLIKGFETAVVGMAVDETKIIKISHIDAYGPLFDELRYNVAIDQLPDGLDPEVGMQLIQQLQDGSENMVTIVEVSKEGVVIDANHPLAGKDLTFEITVVAID